MTDRPVIMSGPMVCAILREIEAPGMGKTMTRRLAWSSFKREYRILTDTPKPTPWQKVNPGHRLWVTETWGAPAADHPLCKGGRKPQIGDRLVYRANPADAYQWGPGLPSQGDFVWRPSIFMPRWASRLTLLVNQVRRERLHEITWRDVIREGGSNCVDDPLWFVDLWNSLHSKPGTRWDDNPEVVAIGFRPVLANIDRLGAGEVTEPRDGMTPQEKADELGFAARVTTWAQLDDLVAARAEREARPRPKVWRAKAEDRPPITEGTDR